MDSSLLTFKLMSTKLLSLIFLFQQNQIQGEIIVDRQIKKRLFVHRYSSISKAFDVSSFLATAGLSVFYYGAGATWCAGGST